jgi:hypothetical protein
MYHQNGKEKFGLKEKENPLVKKSLNPPEFGWEEDERKPARRFGSK